MNEYSFIINTPQVCQAKICAQDKIAKVNFGAMDLLLYIILADWNYKRLKIGLILILKIMNEHSFFLNHDSLTLY
jgi:hypothetical protein